MIKIESINPASQHFMLTSDEPIRVEISLASGTIQACGYAGVAIDPNQDPDVVYDGSVAMPVGHASISDHYSAARRLQVIRAALEFLFCNIGQANQQFLERNGYQGVWRNGFYGTIDPPSLGEVQNMIDGDL